MSGGDRLDRLIAERGEQVAVDHAAVVLHSHGADLADVLDVAQVLGGRLRGRGTRAVLSADPAPEVGEDGL
jgi:hypothetical protein